MVGEPKDINFFSGNLHYLPTIWQSITSYLRVIVIEKKKDDFIICVYFCNIYIYNFVIKRTDIM